MERKIVFVGGIHGVGKGTLCEKVAQNLKITHLSASEVLGWNNFSEDHKNKRVKDINKTQEALANNLNHRLDKNKIYLLDGHFTLISENGTIEEVPLSIFKEIDPVCIVVLKEEPETICKRLELRDNKKYKIDFFADMQVKEIKIAKIYGEILGIEVLECISNDFPKIVSFIEKRNGLS